MIIQLKNENNKIKSHTMYSLIYTYDNITMIID